MILILVRGWSEGDLGRVAGVMAAQRLPPGAEVVSQGAASDALFFLRSGAARAVRRTTQGAQLRPEC